ncbi:MAG: hypothetical protein RSB41_02345 [Bacilli bacterium]
MDDLFDYASRYDDLLDIKPNYGYDRVIPPVKFNYVGFEIEVAVIFKRERYTFIRTLLKKIKELVGNNGYFVKDGTILGDYSFEIVLDPMSIKKAIKIYRTLKKIIDFSDNSIVISSQYNCGIHLNFNQFDIEDMESSHQRLMTLINQKSQYFEENVYKRTHYEFSFKEYLDFQHEVSGKYIGVNYLNKKLVEVRNIKVSLNSKSLETIIKDIINALFPDKLPNVKEIKHTKKIKQILSETFQNNNGKDIKNSLNENLLIIRFTKKGPKIIKVTKEIKDLIGGE